MSRATLLLPLPAPLEQALPCRRRECHARARLTEPLGRHAAETPWPWAAARAVQVGRATLLQQATPSTVQEVFMDLLPLNLIISRYVQSVQEVFSTLS
jgi:hypothetical protein